MQHSGVICGTRRVSSSGFYFDCIWIIKATKGAWCTRCLPWRAMSPPGHAEPRLRARLDGTAAKEATPPRVTCSRIRLSSLRAALSRLHSLPGRSAADMRRRSAFSGPAKLLASHCAVIQRATCTLGVCSDSTGAPDSTGSRKPPRGGAYPPRLQTSRVRVSCHRLYGVLVSDSRQRVADWNPTMCNSAAHSADRPISRAAIEPRSHGSVHWCEGESNAAQMHQHIQLHPLSCALKVVAPTGSPG
jgi:hypothetical protein